MFVVLDRNHTLRAPADSLNTLHSRFLPQNFDPSKPLVVLAGKAIYPVLTVEAARRAGLPVRLVAFHDETRQDLINSFPPSKREIIHVGQLGHMLKALKRFEAGYALMVGQITPKRLFSGLRPDLKAASLLMKLKRRNAETIFGAIAAEIAAQGVVQLDARAFLDDQLASAGWMTKRGENVEQTYLDHGVHIARECARLDIGQGVVVRKGTVIAVEAFEGTDEMLARAGTFKTDEMVFVKTVKPAQDYRFDVPVFGLRTLESMRAARITTALLETDNVLMLEKPAVLEKAVDFGIQIFGFEA